MRIFEFADAEEQLALWKLVSDGVWTAIRAQAEQAARAKAEKAAQAKAKRKAGGSRGGVKSPSPPPDVPMAPPPKPLSPNRLNAPTPSQPKQKSSQGKQGKLPTLPTPQQKLTTPIVEPTNPLAKVVAPPQGSGVGMGIQSLGEPKPVPANQSPFTQPQTRLATHKTGLSHRKSA